MANAPHRSLIVILGPTASGKSALGVRLAKNFHGVVISADSRQVYRGLDIGTAKITKSEMRGVPHFLLDVASPRTQYSVSRYIQDVQRVIKRLPVDMPIFLVGGSPFYIQAVISPNAFSAVPPNLALRRRLATKSTNQLLNQLASLNPGRAQVIDPANRRRLIRAIEIALAPTLPPTKPWPLMRVLKIGLSLPRHQLYTQIDRRVDQRVRSGMMNEARRLHRQGIPWVRLDALGLEYRWMAQYLQGRVNRTTMSERLKGDIHAFARRQLTWWRRDRHIHWVQNTSQAEKMIRAWL